MASARRLAARRVCVPSANTAGLAILFVGVAVRALVLAHTSNELAHRHRHAGRAALHHCAHAAADTAVSIPLATGVKVARIFALVVHRAGTLAGSEARVAPRALRLLVTASSVTASVHINGSTHATSHTIREGDSADLVHRVVVDALRHGRAHWGAGSALAALHTGRSGGAPHTVLVRASRLSAVALGADGLAIQCEWAPVAEVECAALGLVEDLRAHLAALADVTAPLAHAVRNAVGVASVLLAVLTAALNGGIPHAEGVEIARRLSGVANSADRRAGLNRWRVPLQSSWGLDPRAERWVGVAVRLEKVDGAVLTADTRRCIPQAVAVGVSVTGCARFVHEVAALDA